MQPPQSPHQGKMSWRWTAISVCTLVLLAHAFTDSLLNSPPKNANAPALSPRQGPCPGIEGNSDFYGLGIRIGVYLQWFSSWISNSINPFGAASNHDANTIFLVAILIATTVALAQGEIQPVETYIMLLLSSGFVFTVLSFLGTRLHLLRASGAMQYRNNLSATIKAILDGLGNLAAAFQDIFTFSAPPSNPLRIKFKRLVTSASMSFGLRSVSGFKHPALSWAGVVARCTVGTFLATASLLAWWRYPPQSPSDDGGSCAPIFFFFGSRNGASSLLLFFKVTAILLAIPVSYLFLFFGNFVLMFCQLSKDWFARWGAIKMVETISPGAWDGFSEQKKEAIRNMLKVENSVLLISNPLGAGAALAMRSYLRSLDDGDQGRHGLLADDHLNQSSSSSRAQDLSSWNIKASELPHFSVLLQCFMSLWTRGVETKLEAGKVEAKTLDKMLCATMHLVTLAMMSCFIAFIEKTILVAGISGIHTIRTTGQLIPLTIGIASTLLAARETIMLLLKERYPEWYKYHLAFQFGVLGTVIQIVDDKDNEAVDPASLEPPSQHAADAASRLSSDADQPTSISHVYGVQ